MFTKKIMRYILILGMTFSSLFSANTIIEPYDVYNEDGSFSHTVDIFYISGNYPEGMEINGGTVYITGSADINRSLVQRGGILVINGGTLVIHGGYNFSTYYAEAGNGQLHMVNDNDYVKVYGDFSINTKGYPNSSREPHNYLTAGTLEVKGRFLQGKIDNASFGYSFHTQGTHKVLLTGTEQQGIYFVNPGESNFNILEIRNSSLEGITVSNTVVITKELKATTTPITDIGDSFTGPGIFALSGDAIISQGTWDYDLGLNNDSGNWELTQDQTLGGDFYLRGSTSNGDTLDLNGRTLTIDGDLYSQGGILKVNNGTLVVKGNYNFNSDSYAQLHMVNNSDYVKVFGDFTMDTTGYGHNALDPHDFLTAGTLEIKGDFRQQDGKGTHTKNFYAQGTHKVILSGDTEQLVYFQTPSLTRSHFNILEVNNTSATGINFYTTYVAQDLTAYNCHAPLDLSSVTVEGTTLLLGSCDALNDTDGDGTPDYLDSNNNDGPLGDNDNDEILNQDDLDDDNDGMSDVYELNYSFNPFDANDANEDEDEDGYTNLEEYLAGTDPTDNQDVPTLNVTQFLPPVIIYLLN